MPKTLLILAHPNIKESIGNRIISEILIRDPQVEIRHLDQLYPDFKIDIKAEQQAMLRADLIIFQYPLFWYSTPAVLKEWIDQVFEYGFAFGRDAKLTGKKVVASFTMGSSDKDYPAEVIEKITFPFQGMAKYCNMEYLGEIYSNDINNYKPGAGEKAAEIAKTHAEKLIALIHP
ncbi:MAG: NAD(P)H-dependent oxidoreductase [Flavobacteriales bacterium]|nr:NAD(P)H-dependent oxidoreductase [Flavobacteriales bacterium]